MAGGLETQMAESDMNQVVVGSDGFSIQTSWINLGAIRYAAADILRRTNGHDLFLLLRV